MGEILAQQLFNSLLQKDVTQVQAWLNSIWTGKEHIPEDFNWQGLAYVASDKARGDSTSASESPNLEWAKVAVSIYDFLADSQPNANGKESFMCYAMMLRAFMISKLGIITGDEVLDRDRIISWFFNNLKFSPKEALTIVLSWRDFITHQHQESTPNKQQLPVILDKVRELRQIKNRLMAIAKRCRLRQIALLSQSHQFNSNPEIGAWLSLQEKLP